MISRTKVECAGQCLLTLSCSAFSFVGTSCETFNAEYLYRNKNDYNPQEVYIEDALWNMHGNKFNTSKRRKLRKYYIIYKLENDNEMICPIII